MVSLVGKARHDGIKKWENWVCDESYYT
jgi:hypothetical protein